MKPDIREVIFTVIKQLEAVIESSTLVYQFKQSSQTHFIRIFPGSNFNPEIYADIYIDAIEDLHAIQPDHFLCITHEETLVELDAPDYLTWEAELVNVPENESLGSIEVNCFDADCFDVSEDNDQISLAA